MALTGGPLGALEALAGRRPAPEDLTPYTGVVVRVERVGASVGAYVAQLGEDTRHPSGPVYGPHVTDSIGAGDVVLVVPTTDGLWIAAVHEPPPPPP